MEIYNWRYCFLSLPVWTECGKQLIREEGPWGSPDPRRYHPHHHNYQHPYHHPAHSDIVLEFPTRYGENLVCLHSLYYTGTGHWTVSGQTLDTGGYNKRSSDASHSDSTFQHSLSIIPYNIRVSTAGNVRFGWHPPSPKGRNLLGQSKINKAEKIPNIFIYCLSWSSTALQGHLN